LNPYHTQTSPTTKANTVMSLSSLPLFLQRLLHGCVSLIRWILNWLSKVGRAWTTTAGSSSTSASSVPSTLLLDSGKRINVGSQIAEGGFSFVFEAYDSNDNKKKYALKRIVCPEPDMVQQVQREASVHRSIRPHPNIMPLLGMTLLSSKKGNTNNNASTTDCCYLLFPLVKNSLPNEIRKRFWNEATRSQVYTSTQSPWLSTLGTLSVSSTNASSSQSLQQQQQAMEVQLLTLWLGMARAIQTMHQHQYTHRDVKLDNVLLMDTNKNQSVLGTPILMDFGSVGPATPRPLHSRRDVMEIVEQAAQHTTISYRPPELFDGELRSHDTALDYRKVDVYSLGCTFFATLYGASPNECEFARSNGVLQITDCTHVKVLSGCPRLPSDTVAHWYSPSLQQLVNDMLHSNRHERIPMDEVVERIQELIRQRGGTVEPIVVPMTSWGPYSDEGPPSSVKSGESSHASRQPSGDDDEEDGIALMSTNRLV